MATRRLTHPAQYLALIIGAVYTVVGVLGYFVTGFSGWLSPTGALLFGFEVNPLHNLVHLIIGVAGLVMWRPLTAARTYGWLLAVGYGAVFVYGLLVAGTEQPANFLAMNVADNWLHLATALAGLLVALWPARVSAQPAETRR